MMLNIGYITSQKKFTDSSEISTGLLSMSSEPTVKTQSKIEIIQIKLLLFLLKKINECFENR